MERHSIETPLGEVWLWGESDALSAAKPVVLVILGAFAPQSGQWWGLQTDLPEASVLIAQLPGHHSPPLQATSVGAFAAAFAFVARTALSQRDTVVCGESTGGLVALAMDAPRMSRLALDPPLRTEHLWPLWRTFRPIYDTHPEHRGFLESVFGLTASALEPRDYTGILHRPSRVLIGNIPVVPERDIDVIPSLVDEQARDALRQSPAIRLTEVDGVGHMIAGRAPALVLRILRELLSAIEPRH